MVFGGGWVGCQCVGAGVGEAVGGKVLIDLMAVRLPMLQAVGARGRARG